MTEASLHRYAASAHEPGFYQIEAEAGQVRVWSSVPLPLGVTGWKRRMRDGLQLAIAGLTPSPSGHLHAVYAGPTTAPPLDAENPLFYNVGGKHLGGRRPARQLRAAVTLG